MPGESILIVDDTPVNLKLTRILLINEGYKVLTAASGEEAWDLLRNYHPSLVLTDVQLPGIDGLELTRRIKQDTNLRDVAVIALTAFAMKGEEQKAISAGCDGYITKPIDTRSLGSRIREFLDRRAEAQAGPAPPPQDTEEASLPASDLKALRRRFLEEGQEQARQWLLDLDGQFSPNDAARSVHQWIGAAGLLGYSAITRLAREVEAVLLERPLDQSQLRESLTALALAFTSPRDARDLPVPDALQEALEGKRIALVGLPANEAQRLMVAVQRAGAEPVTFQASEGPSSTGSPCDVAVIYVRSETAGSPWLTAAVADRAPLVLIGPREDLLALDPSLQSLASDILMDTWQPEEALMRLKQALQQHRTSPREKPRAAAEAPAVRPRVVIADDDPTVLALVGTAVRNFGMECETAADGTSALELIRRHRPHAAVLDINMPNLDGFALLSTIRREEIPVRVLLLTARQQESDVLRGFSLGADDYVVKPFSPLELVARLKRLLRR
ncbi:MAG TPA: response regulator [Bryobacteraceae bacterium]|nr:response regulator [Bryobacteraceae bacterium]